MSASARLFRIGKDRQGRWVAQDQQGLRGGLFVDRAQALKFAMFENGNRRQAVLFVPYVLDLDMGSTAHSQVKVPTHNNNPIRRAA